jgi:hypothetical protein
VDHRVCLNGLDKGTISVSVIKLKLKKWDRHVEGMGVKKNAYRV